MDIITLVQDLGFPVAIALIFVYTFIRIYNKQQRFIQDKLINVVENNTRVMEQLISVINEMRHELLESQREIQRSLREQRDILIQISSMIKK